ncbi:GrpB family protein [Arthrobacter sp. MYb227]|uniref:GrpB family protein n=1 Tax=Arthrobacter sp. MYb227 TaxID=1848601 RepID=UPI0015E40A69|nr:GrpB family protein [Arthrobacter sp. MYb227]
MPPAQNVVLVPSRYEEWAELARSMITTLEEQIPDAVFEHIGSTSVPQLPAKPVVDLMIGVEPGRILEVANLLATVGFDLEGKYAHHSWLSSPSRTNRVFIVHVLEKSGTAWNRRIVFRDLLRTDDQARNKYLATKVSAAEATDNWDDYTQSKTSVVMGLLEEIGQ